MDRFEREIVIFCGDLKRKLLEKYRKGRKEHGGKPFKIDCQEEVNLEVLDIMNYFLIHKVNKSRKDSHANL